jgi:MSHA biogenesis protein MshI
MKWINKQNEKSWTAIRTSRDNTFLAQVTRQVDSKPLVNMLLVESGNIHSEASVKDFSAKYKLKKAQCAFVLDVGDYQLLQLEKPNVPKEEQRDAVRWKLNDMIDYPVDQATVDLLEIPQDPNYSNRQSNIYAIAAKNTFIGQLINQFLDAGVNLKVIDIQVVAQRNIASLLEQKDRGLAMLSLSHAGYLLTFTSGGELYHARFIEVEEERAASALDRIALELQRSLDSFDRQFPFIALTKLLIAPFEERDELVAHLKTSLYIPVESFELADVFDFSDDVHSPTLRAQADLLPVLGAALREEAIA